MTSAQRRGKRYREEAFGCDRVGEHNVSESKTIAHVLQSAEETVPYQLRENVVELKRHGNLSNVCHWKNGEHYAPQCLRYSDILMALQSVNDAG